MQIYCWIYIFFYFLVEMQKVTNTKNRAFKRFFLVPNKNIKNRGDWWVDFLPELIFCSHLQIKSLYFHFDFGRMKGRSSFIDFYWQLVFVWLKNGLHGSQKSTWVHVFPQFYYQSTCLLLHVLLGLVYLHSLIVWTFELYIATQFSWQWHFCIVNTWRFNRCVR